MIYTVEWGHYKGKRIVQDGDKEVEAETENEAKNNCPKDAEWCHAYIGTSKWL